jgi:hypothetical protein
MTGTVAGRSIGSVRARETRAHEWTEEKRAIFLETLSRTLNISASARAAGMTPVTARTLKRRDAGFAEAWEQAMLAAYEDLEFALLKRAMTGERKAVWHQGKRVGRERVFSERLALQLMARHRDTVMGLRGGRAPQAEDADEIRARLIAKFESMELRLARPDDAE